MVDRKVAPWVFSRKGKARRQGYFYWKLCERYSPNNSEMLRKLVKSQPCCKSNVQGLFCDLFFL